MPRPGVSHMPGPLMGRAGPWMDGCTANLTLTDWTVWWLKVAAGTSGTAWHCPAARLAVGLPSSAQYHRHGHSQLRPPAVPCPPISPCRWLCIWGPPGFQSSPDRGEGARAELSHATCPGQRPQQGEADPALPSPKAIKNEAHSAAHLSSDQITARGRAAVPSSPASAGNATCTAQRPHASHTHAAQKLTGKPGGRKRLHPLPYLPPRAEMLSQKAEPAPAAFRGARIAQGYNGGTGRLTAAGGSDLIGFAKTLTKDTDWEQTKHGRGRNLGKCRDRLGPNTRHRETSPAKQALSLELLQSRGC